MIRIISNFELYHLGFMIHTERLELFPANETVLIAALTDTRMLASALGCQIEGRWSEFGRAPLEYALEKIKANAREGAWWTYFPIEVATNRLIGTCGYKGPPDDEGIVEIGYEVIPDRRRLGFGKEIAAALIRHAWSDPRVLKVLAHTLADTNPSSRILRSCGLHFVRALIDTEDGPIWQWEINRPG